MKKNIVLRTIAAVVALAIFAALQSCAPVFSELQSARTVGKNRFELTPSYSTVSFTSDKETDGIQNHLGLRAAYGITPKLDLRFAYERIWPKEEGEFSDGVDVVGIGPKVSLVENMVAVSLPVGRALGEDSKDSWQFHPTLLLTLPAVPDKFDITLAPKYLFTFCEDCEDLVAVNLGLALSSDLKKWAIRPEYGMLFNPGEEGHFGQFSLGVTVAFGK